MRVLVCGGRDFEHRDFVFEVLDALHAKAGISVIIQGLASGADTFGMFWAIERGVDVESYPITDEDWRTYKGAAGPIRNGQMLDEGKPDMVYAFPGGNGTADMIRQARAAGVKVRECEPTVYNPW